jgi:D-3-phosphoglycerate dehydrogenase / 2-oxoglutarate reductase
MKICRPNVSPYFKDDFISKEKALIESLSNDICYTNILDSDTDILISDTHLKIEKIDFKNIKLILHANSGFDNLLPLKNYAINFPVVLGNEIRAQAVCQYIMTALYNHLGKIPHHPSWDQSRAFNRRSLKHQKIQIIGFGHIGKLVALSIQNLCKELFIYDPLKNHHALRIEEADIIICAASLSKSSQTLLNKEMMKKFKSSVLLINPSRGKIIDQKALIDYLHSHPQAFAILDVYEIEPAHFEAFPSNTLLSSHIAGVYEQLDQDTLEFEHKILRDFLDLKSDAFSLKYREILMENNPVYYYE